MDSWFSGLKGKEEGVITKVKLREFSWGDRIFLYPDCEVSYMNLESVKFIMCTPKKVNFTVWQFKK